MIADSERREVARRLRDSAEERMAAKGRGNGNNWSWLYRSIFGHYMGTNKGAKGRYVEVAYRLADLIEPSEPKARCVAEVKVDGEQLEQLVHDAAVELTGIDRDALLALADAMDGHADEMQDGCNFVSSGDMRDYARRIREALWVYE